MYQAAYIWQRKTGCGARDLCAVCVLECPAVIESRVGHLVTISVIHIRRWKLWRWWKMGSPDGLVIGAGIVGVLAELIIEVFQLSFRSGLE